MKLSILAMRSYLIELSVNNDWKTHGKVFKSFKYLVITAYELGIITINDNYDLELDGTELLGLSNSLIGQSTDFNQYKY